MAIGSSGRIVIEVESDLKQALHRTLRERGSTLKEWFVEEAERLLGADQQQLPLLAENQISDNETLSE